MSGILTEKVSGNFTINVSSSTGTSDVKMAKVVEIPINHDNYLTDIILIDPTPSVKPTEISIDNVYEVHQLLEPDDHYPGQKTTLPQMKKKRYTFVKKLYMIMKIQDLLREESTMVSPEEGKEYRKYALALALEHNLVTRLTSMIIVPEDDNGDYDGQTLNGNIVKFY